ncbi:hypothetical protein CLOM_g9748 [Closterium sp. NIES-68]|nr:hypothetical protein CLOM_g9748 [Closterium sp. NIES-68]GJP76749.1 hypothetical protein CLOP_g7212 [Closterium sp. NIES-67]
MTRSCRRDTHYGRIALARGLSFGAGRLILSTSSLLLLLTTLVGVTSGSDYRAAGSRPTYYPVFSRSLLSSSNRDGIRSAGLPAVRSSSDDSRDDTADDTLDDTLDAVEESANARMAVWVESGGGGTGGDGRKGKRGKVKWLRRGMAAAASGETRVVEAGTSGSASSTGDSSNAAEGPSQQQQQQQQQPPQPQQRQQKGAIAAKKPPRRGSAAGPVGISPHWGGKRKAKKCGRRCGVLHRPIAVYLVWYGAFSAAQKALVRAFVASLSPSADAAVTMPLWWNINRLYYDRNLNYISGNVTVGGEVEDAGYSLGTILKDSGVDTLIRNAITSGQLPFDQNGVYFVLSDETVQQVSDGLAFCSDYCGWHFYTHVPKQGLLVSSWVGNAGKKCRSSCITSQLFSCPGCSPNNDVGMDGLLSVFAHELAEATSDPFMSSWFDNDGEENADKCSWQYGDMLFDSLDGPFYNLVGVDSYKFLIQQNWDLTKGTCATTVPYAATAPRPSPPQQGNRGGLGGFIGRIIGGKRG